MRNTKTWLQGLLLCAALAGCAQEREEGFGDAGTGADEAAGDAAQDSGEDQEQEPKAHALNSGLVTKANALQLNVIKQGSGSGLVVGDDILSRVINCGSDCTETYLLPTDVKLQATASSGSVFTGWSGGCTGTSSTCTLTVGLGGADVTARFEALRTLTVSKTGTGTVTGTRVDNGASVINCGTDCSETVVNGTQIKLTAAAGAGYGFAGWSGACSGSATTCTVSMTAAKSVTAKFAIMEKLTVSKTGSGAGTVAGTRMDTGAGVINCGADCSETVPSGTQIKLTARAASGSSFAGWTGACSGTASTCTVSVTAAKSVSATFKILRSLNLRYVLDGNPNGVSYAADPQHFNAVRLDTGAALTFPITVPDGTSIKITPIIRASTCPGTTCSKGWGFVGWNSSGACASSGQNPCTLTMSANKSALGVFCRGICKEYPL